MPEVISCHMVSGMADFLAEVVVPDLAAYEQFLTERLLVLPMVADVRSNFAIREIKSAGAAAARSSAMSRLRVAARGDLLGRRAGVIDLPASSTFTAVMTDPRFTLALGISVLSGVVRGFSGFGSALIYVPLMSALYGPQIGARPSC